MAEEISWLPTRLACVYITLQIHFDTLADVALKNNGTIYTIEHGQGNHRIQCLKFKVLVTGIIQKPKSHMTTRQPYGL